MSPTKILVPIVVVAAAAGLAHADLTPVGAGNFSPSDPVLTFESGSTALPIVPGVTFLHQGTVNQPGWFVGVADLASFGPGFGNQSFTPLSSLHISGIGFSLATPVQAVGGYLGIIPNYRDEYASQVAVTFLDASDNALGSEQIDLPQSLNSPVFFGFEATGGISTVEFTSVNDAYFAVDNIVYGSVVPVPEPSSIALVGVVLTLAIGWRFRSLSVLAGGTDGGRGGVI